MSFDKNKITAEATRLLQKGQLDKAIRAYERILAADPSDTRALLKIGEIQQKKGDLPSAAETFGRVAEAYGTQGFFLKAVAVYKQMLKLAPDDVRVIERLAQLYQQLGLVSEAMAQLHGIVRWAENAGDDTKLLEALRRVIEFDPEDVPSSVKLGELYARLSQPTVAVEHLRRAADQLKRNNRLDEYAKVAERISALVPEDQGLARDVASAALARGDLRRALQKLQACYRADPQQEETLTLLARVFEELGQDAKVAAVARELGRLHDDAGRREQAREAWSRVLALEPDDPEAREAIGAAAEPPSGAAGAAGAPAAASAAVTSGAPGGAGTEPPAPAPGGAEAVAKILGEADVYVKYGLHEKALEHLQKVLATAPDHVDAREKASRIRELRNDLAGAAEEQLRAIQGARAQALLDRARAGLHRLRQLAPSHPAIAELGSVLQDGAPPAETTNADGLVLELDDLAMEEVEQEVEQPGSVEPGTQTSVDVAAAAPDDRPGAAEVPAIDEDRDDLALSAVAAATDELVEGEPATDSAPAIPAPAATGPAVAAPAGPPRDAAETPAPQPARDAALRHELDEAEFFLSQGLLDEARELLEGLLESWPDDPEITRRLTKLVERSSLGAAPSSAVPARTPVPTVAPRTVTPSAPVADYLYSVRDVLEPFKKGIEQTVTPSDSQTHYDLGIAYKEMSLYDDAIHEFEVARRGWGEARRFDCQMLIGLCRLEAGEPGPAIEAWREALAGEPSADQRRALEYQLALAYEAVGDPQEAARLLGGIVGQDPDYRDARERLARLGGSPDRARPAPEADGPSSGTPASVRRGR